MSSFHLIKHDLKVLGDVIVTGLVDGRDVSVDGTVQDAHISATSGVHGVTGNIVGTSDAQTLTNKTINSDNNSISNIADANIKSAAGIDVSKLADGSVANSAFQNLSGLASSAVGVSDTQTLTNKTLTDTSTYFQNNSDNSKKVRLDVGSVSASTVRVLTVPNEDTTIVGTGATQTLTNKTINADSNTISNIANAQIKALAGIDATKIADGSVANAAFQRIAGLGSAAVGVTDTQTLLNKTLDASTLFQDNVDTTKKLQLVLNAITTGTTRTITVPDADTTLVGTQISQTLTNKTINSDNNTITNLTNTSIKAGAAIDATKIADGSVSNSEFILLNGLTSSAVGVSDAQTLTNKTWGDNLNMGNNRITNVANPVADTDAVNKQYVDNVAAGLDPKDSVRVKTAAALPSYVQSGAGVGATLTASANGTLTAVDGVTLVVGNRVLVDTAVNAAHNGIYTVTQVGSAGSKWIFTRATDADQDSKVTSGMYVFVEEGTTYNNSGFILSTDGAIVVDTTALTFVQFTGAGQVAVENYGTAGVGVFYEKSGNNLRFKNINAGSNKVTVTDDTTNNEIDIDVVPANINILALSGAPTSTIVGANDVQTLTNKTFTDTSTFIQNNADNTKKVTFDLSGLSNNITRTITVPNASLTLVGTNLSQTLTNKTIDADSNTVSNIANANIKAGAAIDVTKISDGSISNTEFGYLNGLSGNIQQQIDDHLAATSAHGVTGAIVGTTDTQTLSNKTLVSPVVQSNLVTTGSYIEVADVSAPSNPGAGKGRLYKKTGATGLYWKADAAVAEIDLSAYSDVSTLGSGVGVYKQRSGLNNHTIELKSINAGSNKVTITDDTANDEVDIDINVANINHQDLSGAGTHTHAEIDTHIDDTNNPHNVTAAQVGNTTSQWNANKLQGIDVSTTAPTDGQLLVYDGLQSKWTANRGAKLTTLIFDDFVTSSLLNMWLVDVSGTNSTVDVIDGVGGQVNVTSDVNTNDYAELRVSNKTLIKSANFKVSGRFKISTNINNYVQFGLYDDANNLIRFVYNVTATPGNWYAETLNGGVSTSTDTTIAADTNWHIFEIHGTSGSVKFYIDGTLRATNTTNLPTTLLRLYLRQTSKTAASRTCKCDYFEAISDRDSS